MNIIYLLSVFYIVSCQGSFEWLLLDGDVTKFNVKRVVNKTEGATELPGSRYAAFSGYSSTNLTIVVYGGSFYDEEAKSTFVRDDMWLFYPASNKWEFKSGSLFKLNVSSVDYEKNQIGARAYGAYKQVDEELFVFGGIDNSNTAYSDLWKLNLETLKWEFLMGEQSQKNTNQTSLGNRLIPSIASEANTSFSTFYIFGGAEMSGFNLHHFNDVWSFDISNNKINVLSESTHLSLVNGSYTEDPYYPKGRGFAATWFENGQLIIYGGYLADVQKYMSDLWSFNITNKKFSLLAGSYALDVPFDGVMQVGTCTPGRGVGRFFSVNNELYISFGGLFFDNGEVNILGSTVFSLDIEDTNSLWNYPSNVTTEDNSPFFRVGEYYAIDSANRKVYFGGGRKNETHVRNDLWVMSFRQVYSMLYDILLIVFLVVVPFAFFTVLITVFIAKSFYDCVMRSKQKRIQPGDKEKANMNEKEMKTVNED